MWGKFFLIAFTILYSLKSKAQINNVEKTGDALQIILPITAFSSTFIYKGNDHGHIQCVKTIGSTFIVTHSLKRIINKKRPNGGDFGFPSGHTSAAFSGAAFIERRYGFKIGIPAYILASYVGWSRVETNYHDYWDVIAGASLGIISGYIFTKPMKNRSLELNSLYQQPVIKISIVL